MADETPKAPEPELSIAPDAEAKPPARPRNLYAFVKQAWKNPRTGVVKETHFQRMVEWRRGNAFVRVERPTRIDRARELGYRAKQGYVVVRARVRRGGRRRPRPMGGRHPKRRGLVKIRWPNRSSESRRSGPPSTIRTWRSSTRIGSVKTGRTSTTRSSLSTRGILRFGTIRRSTGSAIPR